MSNHGGGEISLTFGPSKLYANTMANETKDMIQIAYHDGYSKGLEFTLSVCLCYTLCVLCLRVYIRWKNFAIDDLIIFLSTVRPPDYLVTLLHLSLL